MSSVTELLSSQIDWDKTKMPSKELNSCFYFFDLKTGCRMIALFEAIVSLINICRLQDYGIAAATTASNDLKDVPLFQTPTMEPAVDMFGDTTATHLHAFHMNPCVFRALSSVTVLNSIILLAGAQWDHVSCLVIWICITILTSFLSIFVIALEEIYVIDALAMAFSTALEIYFCFVVFSLIRKIQNIVKASSSEIEVLYTQPDVA